MDKGQRAELLRQRFKAKGGFAYVPSGKIIHAKPAQNEPAKIYLQWPQANRDTRRAGIWMHKPDPKAKPTPRTKRNAGVPVLTRIADKASPKKLKRRFATAETYLRLKSST